MRSLATLLGIFVFAAHLCISPISAQTSQDGVLDFETYPNAPEIYLNVEKLTGVYVDFGFYNYILNLLPGTKVRLLAYHPTQYLIQCDRPACRGWIDPANVTPLKPDVIDNFKKQIQEDQSFAEAIKKKQILPNMAPRHVLQALGEPTNKNFNADTTNSRETWSYLTTEKIYETVRTPVTYMGQDRRPYTTYIMEKREVGEKVVASLTIEFKNGKAVALQQSKSQEPSSKKRTIPDQQWNSDK